MEHFSSNKLVHEAYIQISGKWLGQHTWRFTLGFARKSRASRRVASPRLEPSTATFLTWREKASYTVQRVLFCIVRGSQAFCRKRSPFLANPNDMETPVMRKADCKHKTQGSRELLTRPGSQATQTRVISHLSKPHTGIKRKITV